MSDSTSERLLSPDETKDDFSVIENMAPSSTYTEDSFMEDSRATIQRVLSSYEVGRKLRALRLKKKIGLADLGRHTGLSASMISQLENGKLVPTLPTLARIAMVFDVGLEHFFASRAKKRPLALVRAEERIRFPDRAGAIKPNFLFECLAFSTQEKSLQAYLAQFPRRKANEVVEHIHDGAEFIHVLEGTLILRYSGEDHELNAGDSVYFDGSEPHSYRGGLEGAQAIVVTTPPRI
jgi:transcriptional regulator with XRE-family HTH domain